MDQAVATRPPPAKPVWAPVAPKARRFRARKLGEAGRHWVRGDAYATALFNALSAVFPHGEAFMIESIRPWRDRVAEPLASEIATFMEQEGAHTREHGVMNKALIAMGYDVAPLDKAIRKFVDIFSGAGDITRLGATMCIEHLTAVVGAELLRDPRHLQGADPEMHKLWLWHAIEEIEHKAVAFDTWMAATAHWSGARRWLVRSTLHVLISASFFFNRTRGQVELMRQDGVEWKVALPELLRRGFGKGGIARNVLRSWAAFLKPGFQPWDIDDRHLLIKGENMLAALQLVTEGKVGISIGAENIAAAKAA